MDQDRKNYLEEKSRLQEYQNKKLLLKLQVKLYFMMREMKKTAPGKIVLYENNEKTAPGKIVFFEGKHKTAPGKIVLFEGNIKQLQVKLYFWREITKNILR